MEHAPWDPDDAGLFADLDAKLHGLLLGVPVGVLGEGEEHGGFRSRAGSDQRSLNVRSNEGNAKIARLGPDTRRSDLPPCAAGFASPPMSARSSSSCRPRRASQPRQCQRRLPLTRISMSTNRVDGRSYSQRVCRKSDSNRNVAGGRPPDKGASQPGQKFRIDQHIEGHA